MNDEILLKIDEQIAHHLAEVARLQAARKALSGRNGVAAPAGPKKAPARRAPPHALEDAVEKLLAAKPGQTNGEIRKALAKDGYEFALTPLHVGKRLSALVEEKHLRVKLDGNLRRYYPVK